MLRDKDGRYVMACATGNTRLDPKAVRAYLPERTSCAGCVYTQDPYQADEYELYILRRAGDLAPLERERMALILGESR